MTFNLIGSVFKAYLLCLILLLPTLGQTTVESQVLQPDRLLEREISGAEVHRYKFDLQANDFFKIRTEQKGVNILLKLIDKNGKVLKEMDVMASKQGIEELIFIIPETGTYTVEVACKETDSAKGNYSIVFPTPKSANEKDLLIMRTIDSLKAIKAASKGVDAETKRTYLEEVERAKKIFQDSGNKSDEAAAFGIAGDIYLELGESQKALKELYEALRIHRATGNREYEATILANIGGLHNNIGENKKALEVLEQSLSINRSLGIKRGEAFTLTTIGNVYNVLGDRQKALELYNQSLSIHRQIGEKYGAAYTLSSIGNVYLQLQQKEKALEYLNQALELRRLVGDKRGEAQTLNNIGGVYFESGDKQKATEYFEMTLPLRRATGDRFGESFTLYNIGGIAFRSGDNEKAILYLNKALLLCHLIGNKRTEANALDFLAQVWHSLKNRKLAVFYEKQAVNKLHELRQDILKLDKRTQLNFLRSIKWTYKGLVSSLIEEKRYAEAIQVINMFRDQEFYDIKNQENKPVAQTVMTAREAENLSLLRSSMDKVFQAEKKLTTLKESLLNRQPDSAEVAELKTVEADIENLSEDFLKAQKLIENNFNRQIQKNDEVKKVIDAYDMQSILKQVSGSGSQKTAALYTLVAEDKFHILLITPKGKIENFEFPIKVDDLNKKIFQFYALLQSPDYDPRPLSKELYDIIFKPVEASLLKQNIKTLMWQLDDNLRYLPMAALFDGKQFLAERFNHVNFTRADKARMTRRVSKIWTASGFGASEEKTVELLGSRISFEALPGVGEEFKMLFKPKTGDRGIFEGEFLQNAAFNKKAMLDALKQKRPLVHIASHFSFRPGDEARSFLLLGDGNVFTLEEMKQEANLFEGVELLTLSACNTAATQADANGREIDGFAELAQRLGANSVMATLWQVSDASTPLLMKEFYEKRQTQKLNKAESLKNAQLALLKGTAKAVPIPDAVNKTANTVKLIVNETGEKPKDNKGRGIEVVIAAKNAPLYKKDPKAPFAHPYYWSPFVLIGNWR